MTTSDSPVELLLTSKVQGADNVTVLQLRHPSGHALPGWAPGAHIDLVLEPELIRQYSLCGNPEDRYVWQVAVLRENAGRGGSQYVHDKLAEGDTISVVGPRNNFDLLPSPNYVFIAGGIGITPILSMVEAAAQQGSEWKLHYGGRTLASMVFAQSLRERFGDNVILYPSDAVGRIELDSILAEPVSQTLVYCCGPAPLVDAVSKGCESWPSGSLHVERFVPKEMQDPVLRASFEVELALTGKTITVTPAQSVLDAVAAAGVQVLSSCREGTCGTCETPVISGEVDHRDSLLTPEEQAANDTMLICVSRAACPKISLEL